MKLISWNVNGIRAILNKGFNDFVKNEQPDILCLQETKAEQSQVDKIMQDYEHHFWNSAEKKGYSGTAIFSKEKPMSVQLGMGLSEHDKEGRLITLEFPKFNLINCYTPNSQRELTRLSYRMKWETDFRSYLKSIEKKTNKPVLLCGDLNVAHQEIDLANPLSNRKNAGFTDEERLKFTELLGSGFVDTFRLFNSETNNYTWWSYMFNARQKNIGWRIDYFVASENFKNDVKDSFILNKVAGSDHCPVGVEIK